MTPPDRGELERLWSEVRSGFAEYRLDDLRKILDIPPDAPVPDRAQARQFAAALPDLSKARFLKVQVDGDLAGYYAQTGTSGTEVSLIRFRRAAAAWRLMPAPHTFSSFSTDENLEPEELIRREPSLAMGTGPAPAPARPEAEIRREIETMWKRIRSAFASGRPDMAAGDLLYVDGATPPSADEARTAARDRLPDLVRGRFLKLGWRSDKPQLVGYFAETKTGDFRTSTVSLIVFVNHEGRWKFAPGPASIESVEVPKAGRARLLDLIETDPRLAL